MKKTASIILVLLMIAVLCLPLAAEESEHNHKHYIDYITRSANGRTVESFGIFCEDCDEVTHIKTGGTVIDYSISYNGWGADGQTTWYFIDGLVTLKDPLRISGTVNLVLLDSALLICEGGIRIFENGTLNIYSEHLDYSPAGKENTMGTLRAYVREEAGEAAAIGGLWDVKNVTVNIYGGDIYALSEGFGAAIGSGYRGGATVNIYGGKVRAVSHNSGAAIGSGYDYANAELNFRGGIVHADSTDDFSASIGCGFWECHATVNYYGGYVLGEPNEAVYSKLAGITADTVNIAKDAKKIGSVNGLYDNEGLALAKQAGWIDGNGYPVGSVLSDGNGWILAVIAVAAVTAVAVLLIANKKAKEKGERGDDALPSSQMADIK